jgi:hypothetical protein
MCNFKKKKGPTNPFEFTNIIFVTLHYILLRSGYYIIKLHSTTRVQFLVFFKILLISNFRHVLNVVCFLLGNSPASEVYIPTFRNTLSVPSS